MKKIALAAALLLTLSACDLTRPEQREDVTYDVTEQVAALTLTSDAGDISVAESDRTGVRVTETLRWRGNGKPRPEHRVHQGELDLRYTCEQNEDCSIDYRVEIPRGLRLTLHTGAGDVEATGLSSVSTKVDTGAGDVTLAYTAAPESVGVESGAGDVTLRLPSQPYNLSVRTGAGDNTVSVPTDPGSPRRVAVETGAGNVHVLAA